MTPAVEDLAWDSKHFGRAVAKIVGDVNSLQDLEVHLEDAHRRGIWLLYWLASPSISIPLHLLSKYGGRRVGGHDILRRPLIRGTPASGAPTGISIRSALGQPLCPELRQLGIIAGDLSRYRVDTRLPPERANALYETWIARSLAGELATDVIVAYSETGDPLSLITYRILGSTADIGLVSTHPEHRGRGLARSLMEYAHGQMLGHGAQTVDVVTQTENTSAARLYTSAGYALAVRNDYYHFINP